MPEDGGAGMDPHEHLHEVGEDRHEEDGVGGEVLKLKAELLQEQEEEGGDRRHQPTHGVRVEEDELPRGQVVEGNFACLDLPDELRRGPSQKAAHRVKLDLALEAAGMTKRRHHDGRCDCGGWIAREQEGEEMPSAKSRLQMCVRRRRGAAASGEGKSEKVADLFGACLLRKAARPLELRSDRREAERLPTPSPLLSHSMTGGPSPSS
jgi:hypothetical protein